MAKKTETPGRGRPQLYPLTTNQEKSVRSRLAKGETSPMIQDALGIHAYAIVRVKRAIKAGR